MEGIASERGINRTIRIISKRNKNNNLPISEKQFFIDNYWNSNDFAMLDIITDFMLREENGGFDFCQISKNPYTPKITGNGKYKISDERLNHLKNDVINKTQTSHKMAISCNDIRDRYSHMEKLSCKKIFERVKKVSDTQFKLCYPFRAWSDNKKCFINRTFDLMQAERTYNYFDLKSEYVLTKSGKVKDVKMLLDFNNILGYLYVINTTTMNVDFIRPDFYDLSSPSQNFYRIFLLSYKNEKFEYLLGTIKEKLNFYSVDDSKIRGQIIESLEELKDRDFIKSYELNLKKSRFSIIKSTKISSGFANLAS